MSEEIKIVVREEHAGPSVLKDAKKDAEALQHNGGKSSLATPPPNLNAPPPPAAPRAADAKRAANQRNRANVADAEEDLARAKARGADAGEINDLHSQLREQKLAGRFQSQQGLSEDDAIKKAQTLVALQNQAKARKEQEAAATKQQAADEAAAAKKLADDKKTEAAAAKAAEKTAAEEKKAVVAKEKIDAKAVTDEHRQQESLAKSRESYAKRIARAGGNFAEGAAGGSPFGGIASAIGSTGGPVGTAVAAIAAVTLGVVAAFAKQRDQMQIMGMEDTNARFKQDRQLKRMAGFEGTAEGNRIAARDYEDDAKDRNQDRQLLQKKAQFKWYNPAGWLDKMTGASENEGAQNDMAIGRDIAGAKKAHENQAQKYAEQVAPLIEAQRKINQGHATEGRALQDQVTRIQEKNRLLREGATEADAAAGAQVKMDTIAREREGSYAKLVTARDGSGDIARMASLAREERSRTSGMGVDEMRQDMNRNHREAADASWLKLFHRA